MVFSSLVVGGCLGVLGYTGKEIYKILRPTSKVEIPKGMITEECWNEIWLANGVKIKLDDEEQIPKLINTDRNEHGFRYLFKYPVGMSSERMKKCMLAIKEISNFDDVEVVHHQDNLVYIYTTRSQTKTIDVPEEIQKENERWMEFWVRARKGIGDKESGFEYPVLTDIEMWESGIKYHFAMPIGLSTHHIKQVDIALKEFLGVGKISIDASEKAGYIVITTYAKELPSIVKYELIKRENRDELEVVLGRSHTGWKRLKLLGGTHNVFVGGAIGTGKSVAINAILTDLALNYKPSELQMWIMDLKIVEMSHFRKLKHVHSYGETVQDMMHMIDSLTEIMWDRYTKMKEKGVKKISAYNKLVPKEEQMPYILFVVEEIYEFSSSKLASGTGKKKKNAEEGEDDNYIDKLAVLLSKCRGAGMGAIISSQRLMNAYIPRNISANLMNRLCFKVSDSKESSLLTDDRFDATTLRGNGHGALIDTEVEEFQGFFIDEDHGEVTELLKKHNLLRD